MAWVEDRVPIYDLAQKDLEKWLKDKFGNWKFKVHKTNDEFVFLAPRKLTAKEKEDEIADLRVPDEED